MGLCRKRDVNVKSVSSVQIDERNDLGNQQKKMGIRVKKQIVDG